MGTQQREYSPVRRLRTASHAIVFLHGFTGQRDSTWERFPSLLAAHVPDCDVYTLGYPTGLGLEPFTLSRGDPSIGVIAEFFSSSLHLAPFGEYPRLTLIAHSMGGLVAQQALVRSESLVERVTDLLLFGTPSLGVEWARYGGVLKRQIRDLAPGSDFLLRLRDDWERRIVGRDLRLRSIVGMRDRIAEPATAHRPFPLECCWTVSGDHTSIVKPDDCESLSLICAVDALGGDGDRDQSVPAPPPVRTISEVARDATEQGLFDTQEDAVRAALDCESNGDREAAIRLLERHAHLGTDVQGTLAGRHKRLWLDAREESHAARARELYQGALDQALQAKDFAQAHYQAINVAFLQFVAFADRAGGRRIAREATDHAIRAGDDRWSVATRAEACLYLGDRGMALALYGRFRAAAGPGRELESARLQAIEVARSLGDESLERQLEEL